MVFITLKGLTIIIGTNNSFTCEAPNTACRSNWISIF